MSKNITNQFTSDFTERSAYILGLLWADGYIPAKSKERGNIIFISTEPDSVYFTEELKKTLDWSVYHSKDEKHPTWKTRTTMYFRNTDVSSFLLENDYSSKTTVGADKILNKIPKNLHRFFLLGVIDGDGCFSVTPTKNSKYNKRFSIASSYEQDWSWIERILLEEDIRYKIERTKGKSGAYSKIHITRQGDIEKFGNILYKSIKEDGIGLPRKYEKYKQICSMRRRKTSRFERVCKVKNRWKAYLPQKNGEKCKWISGSFDTEEDAAKAAGTFTP